jgi:L-ascorbate metabolism protein UlaG (beta-lactamase superfamily)
MLLRIAGIVLSIAIWITPIGASADVAVSGLSLRWLGVAGFSVSDGETVLLHDPYLSRPGLLTTLFTRYRPDVGLLSRWLAADGPAPEAASARTILIGHSHFDHLGDAAWIADRIGAGVVGSGTTVAIAQGYGLAERRTRRVDPGDEFDVGPFEIRVVASGHAAVMFGRVPLTGEVLEPPAGPIHALSFKLGDARGYLVTHLPSGLRVYLTSSAAVDRPALEGLRDAGFEVDVLLAAIAGRGPEYVPSLIELLRPRIVIPHHFDDFFVALSDPTAGTPTSPEDLEAFADEVRVASERFGTETEVRRIALFERFEVAAD